MTLIGSPTLFDKEPNKKAYTQLKIIKRYFSAECMPPLFTLKIVRLGTRIFLFTNILSVLFLSNVCMNYIVVTLCTYKNHVYMNSYFFYLFTNYALIPQCASSISLIDIVSKTVEEYTNL